MDLSHIVTALNFCLEETRQNNKHSLPHRVQWWRVPYSHNSFPVGSVGGPNGDSVAFWAVLNDSTANVPVVFPVKLLPHHHHGLESHRLRRGDFLQSKSPQQSARTTYQVKKDVVQLFSRAVLLAGDHLPFAPGPICLVFHLRVALLFEKVVVCATRQSYRWRNVVEDAPKILDRRDCGHLMVGRSGYNKCITTRQVSRRNEAELAPLVPRTSP